MAPAVKGLTHECQVWKDRVAELSIEVQEIKAERDALRAFAQDLTKEWPDEIGMDGFDLQDLLVKHGLIAEKCPKPTKPCAQGEGACNCASYYAPDEWAGGVVCYRRTALLSGPA